MGHDTEVILLQGFRIKLSEAFYKEWLDSSIMDDDDWQYLNMEEDLNEIIEKYVLNKYLKNLLGVGWSLYILASTQENIDSDKSYLFIYIDKQEIDLSGEYVAEEINNDTEKIPFPEFPILGLKTEEWKLYCIVNTSW